MPTRLSSILGLTRKDLEDKEVFDATIDFDSHLHIDPALLSRCKIPEFIHAAKKVKDYFNNILLLVKNSKGNDSLRRTAVQKLTFGEGLNTGLGYSESGTDGSGIGPEIAERIVQTAKEIVDAGIVDPAIFDLVPVIEPGIGPDRISDMISIILKDEFIAFTDRIVKELRVHPPVNSKGKRIILVPKQLLSDLPIVDQWEEVPVAAAYNDGIRQAISGLIGKSWKEVVSEYSKRDLRDMLIKNPELLKEILAMYNARSGAGYDFDVDHLGILLWDVVGNQMAEKYNLDLAKYKIVTADNIVEIVTLICIQFQKLIEHNGLVEHLYDSNGKKRPERFAQLLFYAVADSYCTANGLDLSREINAGSGALDFKVSRGSEKVTVELKFTSNPKLVEGYEKQLSTYNKAEGVRENYSFYLVLRVNKSGDVKLRKIQAIIDERIRQKQATPLLIIIQSIKLPPASKR